ncbi:DUF3108 domain-containing protein [Teredinibacter turnerae]|uniref:DUF3108 domain-containing protein n=1 Tax=Teredinibacter turnerae TaxID=2426 RepID=UPI0030CE9B8C
MKSAAMQNLFFPVLVTFTTILVSFCAHAGEPLFTAEYEGKYSGLTITSTRQLEQLDNGKFQLNSVIKNSFASITEESQFTFDDGIMVPQSYHYKRKILAFKADENFRFDWPKATVYYEREDKPEKNREFPLELGVLDPALYQLQVQRAVAAGHTKIDVTFVKSSKIKTLHFKKTGEETLQLGDKSYQSILVERDNRDDDKETRLWIVPDLNYQIARVEHVEENGDKHSIRLTSYKSSANLSKVLYTAAKAQ